MGWMDLPIVIVDIICGALADEIPDTTDRNCTERFKQGPGNLDLRNLRCVFRNWHDTINKWYFRYLTFTTSAHATWRIEALSNSKLRDAVRSIAVLVPFGSVTEEEHCDYQTLWAPGMGIALSRFDHLKEFRYDCRGYEVEGSMQSYFYCPIAWYLNSLFRSSSQIECLIMRGIQSDQIFDLGRLNECADAYRVLKNVQELLLDIVDSSSIKGIRLPRSILRITESPRILQSVQSILTPMRHSLHHLSIELRARESGLVDTLLRSQPVFPKLTKFRIASYDGHTATLRRFLLLNSTVDDLIVNAEPAARDVSIFPLKKRWGVDIEEGTGLRLRNLGGNFLDSPDNFDPVTFVDFCTFLSKQPLVQLEIEADIGQFGPVVSDMVPYLPNSLREFKWNALNDTAGILVAAKKLCNESRPEIECVFSIDGY